MDKSNIYKGISKHLESTLKKTQLAEQRINQSTMQEAEKPNYDDSVSDFKKSKVERFFKRLNKSSIKKLMDFKTDQEKAEAIAKFAEFVGVPRSKLSSVVSQLRGLTQNK
jgi:predicted nucleotidyltransferase